MDIETLCIHRASEQAESSNPPYAAVPACLGAFPDAERSMLSPGA